MKKVIVFGNFPANGKCIAGQHIRSDNVYNLLKRKYPSYSIKKIDTESNKLLLLLRVFWSLIFSYRLVVMPGRRFLYVLSVLLTALPFFNSKVVCVAIGGWIPSFIESNRFAKRVLSRLRYIYVQVPSMANKMTSIGFDNVLVLPNFRLDVKDDKTPIEANAKGTKFIFVSRICEDKGVISLIQSLNNLGNNFVCDFYGPIDPMIKDVFFKLINKNPQLHYNGELANEKVVSLMRNYDVLVFPTRYEGEGFPGVILEAIYADLFVLASDWKYNKEVISEFGNGKTYSLDLSDSLENELKLLIDSPLNFDNGQLTRNTLKLSEGKIIKGFTLN